MGWCSPATTCFRECKSFVQEADPWQWLAALERIGELDVATIVPGHGEPCSKAYLSQQAQVLHNWIGVIERLVERGLSEEEAVAEPIDVVRDDDPYPIGQRLFPMSERVTEWNVRNVYKHVLQKRDLVGCPRMRGWCLFSCFGTPLGDERLRLLWLVAGGDVGDSAGTGRVVRLLWRFRATADFGRGEGDDEAVEPSSLGG